MARKDMLKKMKKPEAPMEEELMFAEEDMPELEDEELGLEEEAGADEGALEEARAQLEAAGFTVIGPDEEEEAEGDEAPLDEEEEEELY